MELKYVTIKQTFSFDETQAEKYVPKQAIAGKVYFIKLCSLAGSISEAIQLANPTS